MISPKKTYQLGIFAELVVIIFLLLKGYQILHWRYKTKFGEIDIIAKRRRLIAIIEVKSSAYQINVSKVLRPQQILRIKKSAEFFLSKNSQFSSYSFSFDFIEVRAPCFVKHHRNLLS